MLKYQDILFLGHWWSRRRSGHASGGRGTLPGHALHQGGVAAAGRSQGTGRGGQGEVRGKGQGTGGRQCLYLYSFQIPDYNGSASSR